MNDWDESKPIDVETLKSYIKDMRMAKDIYDEARELSNEAHAKYKEKEGLVLSALNSSGLKNFNIPGLGTASVRRTFKVTCPRTLEEKRLLFDYVKETHGEDFLDSFRGINSQTLNKFYSEEISTALERGEDLRIPGLADPVEHASINFRKDNK